MKKLLYFLLGSIALGTALQAGEQTQTVTPLTLDGWTVTAADKSTLTQASTLMLPEGAQLSRSFDSNAVAVRLATPLIFGLAGEDYTTLEVGPAALVFSREGMAGQVTLVTGDNRSYPLPFTVKLNVDGSSTDPIDVQLAYERVTGEIIIIGFGQTLRYVTDSSAKPVEVVISAGTHDPLTLQSLTVSFTTSGDQATDAKDGNVRRSKTGTGDTTAGGPKSKTVIGGPSTGNGTLAATGPTSADSPPDPAAKSTLEVYTPSAVRHGRVDAIRAIVVQGKGL